MAQPDASFVSSLMAQGFSESESASKLIYNFEKRSRSPSPVARRRSPSPAKSPNRRFIEPQESRGRTQVRPTVLSSPTKERHRCRTNKENKYV